MSMSGKPCPEINIEGEHCPQAVVDWYKCSASTDQRRDYELSLKAKKHLISLGWIFSFYDKKTRWELRYKSPLGKTYISLRTACKACIEQNNLLPLLNQSSSASNSSSQESQQSQSQSHEPEPPNSKKCSGRPRKRKNPREDDSGDIVDWILSPNRVSPPSSRARRLDFGENVNASRKEMRARSSSGNSDVPSFRNPRTILSWLIDNNVVAMDAWVYCRGGKDNDLVKRGKLNPSGIVCNCCDSLFTLTQFEAHAGCNKHHPSATIFLEEDRRSLMDCQRQALMMINAQKGNHNNGGHVKNNPKRENDSICSICLKGGLILLCDHCSSSFHAGCIGLDQVPDGDWFCPLCSCRICNRPKCREDFSAGENHMTNNVIACDQCHLKFHFGCLASRGFTSLEMEKDSNGHWFCSDACEGIFSKLHDMLGEPVIVGHGNLTWTLLKSNNDDNGGISEMESKLNVALGVMHECFEPIVDTLHGKDIAADVMFSREYWLQRLNFKGFYTVILERNDEVISVANTRIYGQKVAEVPLIATRERFRKRGMCRVLMKQLEKLLVELGVERLVLPASPHVIETWTNSFGFAKMTESEQYQCLRYALVNFPDTTLCHKSLKQPLMLLEA